MIGNPRVPKRKRSPPENTILFVLCIASYHPFFETFSVFLLKTVDNNIFYQYNTFVNKDVCRQETSLASVNVLFLLIFFVPQY